MFLRPIKSPSLPPIGVIIDKPSAENIENKPTYPIAFTLSNIGDVSVAKNYLSDKEMRSLQHIASAYLDLAEDRAERHIPMTMEDWSKRLDLFLMADDREVLQDAGKITAEIAKAKAETEFEKYRVIQDRLFVSDFDKYMLELEESTKK